MDGTQRAGALAFYALFSLARLVIILVTLVGIVFGAEAARGEISAGISGLIGAQPAEAVEEAVRRSRPAYGARGRGGLALPQEFRWRDSRHALGHLPRRSGSG